MQETLLGKGQTARLAQEFCSGDIFNLWGMPFRVLLLEEGTNNLS
jgi:hypothetical protein